MRTDFGAQRAAAPSGGGRGGGAATNFGGSEKCPRCGKSVYAAEKVIGAGSVSTVRIGYRLDLSGSAVGYIRAASNTAHTFGKELRQTLVNPS